ncbi:hypothetical protein HPB50_018847 [Hyalomma asiaticum]|uniref:Uncharacterized protein n=1 Tax=Hyalomma asiaticum TaxID=266040 RepID=A0ACB7S7D6_HYAAI|nr:hypothetical protein HPB50_018847 [Hyalomma asiaticum]
MSQRTQVTGTCLLMFSRAAACSREKRQGVSPGVIHRRGSSDCARVAKQLRTTTAAEETPAHMCYAGGRSTPAETAARNTASESTALSDLEERSSRARKFASVLAHALIAACTSLLSCTTLAGAVEEEVWNTYPVCLP